jgi:glycosyltransferase involved in cell wall biosynthesis
MNTWSKMSKNPETSPRVLMIMNSISRSSGGASSFLDLAETAYELGFHVTVALSSGHIRYLLQRSRSIPTILPTKSFTTIPQSFLSPSSRKKRQGFLGRFVSVFEQKSRRFWAELKSSDLIVTSPSLSSQGLKTIRQNTKAFCIKNHAGSAKAFANWFIKDGDLEGYLGADKMYRYVRYCRQYDGLLFQAWDQAEQSIELGAVDPSRAFLLQPSTVERDVLAALQSDSPYDSSRTAIVVVGSLQPRKGQDKAFEAFDRVANRIPDTDLHFVGGNSSEFARNLAEIAKKSAIASRIFFHGFRPDYLRYMAHADLIVQSSIAEGVSRVLREAMLMRLPIVSFAISGTVSLLKDGEDAVLVEPENVSALADGITEALSNGEVKNQMANSAFRKYCIGHSRAAYASTVSTLMRRLSKPEEMP